MNDLETMLAELEVERPSERTFTLSLADAAFASALLEIKTWVSDGDLGDASHVILDTVIDGRSFYVQFLAEPSEASLLCEVSSGFYGDASAYVADEKQSEAVRARGFSDGGAGNFKRVFAFETPAAAERIASDIRALLAEIFALPPTSEATAKLRHTKSLNQRWVFDTSSRSTLVELLLRHGANSMPAFEADATLDTAMRGVPFTVTLTEKGKRGHCAVTLRANVGACVDLAAMNRFNARTPYGRSWLDDGSAFLGASIRLTGQTEGALHDLLDDWATALVAAKHWYERVACDSAATLEARHFDPAFQNVERMVSTQLALEGQDQVIAQLFERARDSKGDVDAWALTAAIAAENPDRARPVDLRAPGGIDGAEVRRWLDRVAGVEATETRDGRVTIGHLCSTARLDIAPQAVRRLAMNPDRAGLLVTLANANANDDVEVEVGPADFFFAPTEPKAVVRGITFNVDGMKPSVSWFETRSQLRALERLVACVDARMCGHRFAWVTAALAGAARAGIDTTLEQERFAKLQHAIAE